MDETPTDPPALTPELLRDAARRIPEAQEAWYRAEYPCVFRLCLGFLAHATTAEDLATDAMLHLLDRLDRWDPAKPYPAWRSQVVLNLCRDRLRRTGARRRAEERLQWRPAQQPLPDPQDVAAGKEIQTVITQALAQLPPREREAFVLRDLEHCPTDEVATAMGIRPATVRSLLTLARRRLRDLLAPALELGPRRFAGGDRG